MKVSKEKVAEHRARILKAAGQLFRARGFDAVTVAEIMKAAGLTHGAFYGYFPSKEALIAEAADAALVPSDAVPSPAWVAAYIDSYLSARHRDNRADSCLFSAIGTEAARGAPDLRQIMTDATRRQLDRFTAAADGGSEPDKRRAAIATWSAMVGAMVLARIVDDPALSDEILAQTRAALPLA